MKTILSFIISLICLVTAKRCFTTSECIDNLSCSIDFCDPRLRSCLNIGTTAKCNTTQRLISEESLIDEANKPELRREDMLLVINVTYQILKDFHPHRNLHLNFLKVDPVLELKTFRAQLSGSRSKLPTNVEFHEKMISIFRLMNDLHTTYNVPAPLNNSGAILPFDFRPYYTNGEETPGYVVTDVAQGTLFRNPTFSVGAKIITWDGRPIHDVVKRFGEDGYGSNNVSKLANGVKDLRARFFHTDPIPKEKSITIEYIDSSAKKQSIMIDWMFIRPTRTGSRRSISEEAQLGMPFDLSTSALSLSTDTYNSLSALTSSKSKRVVTRMTKTTSRQLKDRRKISQNVMKTGNETILPVNRRFHSFLAAKVVPTSRGPLGIITILSFNLIPSNFTFSLLSEFERILRLMPQEGLVVDVRRNRGGTPVVERFIQLLTNKGFSFSTFTFRTTDLISEVSRSLVRTLREMGSLLPAATRRIIRSQAESLRTARLAGDDYVSDYPFLLGRFPPSLRAAAYEGSYVVLADGLTYSAGDLFVTIHKDNELAPVVLEGGNIGAGGSSTLKYSEARGLLALIRFPNMLQRFPQMPGRIDFSFSIFRLLRAGFAKGAILENFGIIPDLTYFPTLRDRLDGEKDLYETLAKVVRKESMNSS